MSRTELSECEPWVGLDNPAVRLSERLGGQPRLECTLPDSKIAKDSIGGVSRVALWSLVGEDKFVAVTIGRARPREFSDVRAWTLSAIECRQGLLQSEVLGPLAHEFTTLFE